jgi:hypothetical protein
MAIVWPPEIPWKVLGPGLRRGPDANGRIASQVDGGKAKMRPRHTADIVPLDLPVEIARAQLPAFEAFYGETLAKGTQEFEVEDPERLATVTVRFRPGEQEPWEAQREPGGKFYIVLLKLEVVP